MRVIGARDYIPLLIVTLFSLVLKAYDPIHSPVVGAFDPWGWTYNTRLFLATGELGAFFAGTGYPPTFMYLVAALASLGTDPYNVIRYMPVASSISVIPIYLLTLEVFRSHKVSALASGLTVTARYFFMRTSIGIPEGLSHFFFIFMLLFVLRALTTRRWIYGASATMFMTISIMYYHFTFLILIPFVIAILFAMQGEWLVKMKVLGGITLSALFLSGFVWYFRVLLEMFRYYTGTRVYTYAAPVFEHSLRGYLYVLIYSVGKSGAVALSDLGYAMMGLALIGVASLVVSRKAGNKCNLKVRFLATYLAVLVVLTLALRIVYNLGIAGAGDSSVYLFSWMTMPVAAFGGYGFSVGSNALGRRLQRRFQAVSLKHISKLLIVSMMILLCLVNLTAIDYYKASSGNGLGVLRSHYYYKFMTDQEYAALDYIRRNTPETAVILTIGVEEPILECQNIVAERAIVGIRNMTATGKTILLEGSIVRPRLYSAEAVALEMDLGEQAQQEVYLITGVKKVNLQTARTGGSLSAENAVMESNLINLIRQYSGYERFYENEQVTVLKVLLARIG
jgi:hypothetical protein